MTSLTQWNDIHTAPIGPTILLANENTGHVCAGYGEWMNIKHANIPRFISCDPEGFGRFKATHWMPMPEAPQGEFKFKLIPLKDIQLDTTSQRPIAPRGQLEEIKT